jgi:hypothetical protein
MEVRESNSTIRTTTEDEVKRDEERQRMERNRIVNIAIKVASPRMIVNEDGIEEEHLKFLDELRESGVTNMFGATPFIEEEFGLNHDRSVEILVYWMRTFTQRHTKEEI